MKVAIFCNTRTASKLVLNRLAILLKLKSLSEPFSNFTDRSSPPYTLEESIYIRDNIYDSENIIFKIASFNYNESFDSIEFIDYSKFDKIIILNRKNLVDIVCSIYAGEIIKNLNFEDDSIDCIDYIIPIDYAYIWKRTHNKNFIKVSNLIKEKSNNVLEIFYEDLKHEFLFRSQIQSFFNIKIPCPLYEWRESNIKNRCLNYFEIEDIINQ
jgi:hypothetical protein